MPEPAVTHRAITLVVAVVAPVLSAALASWTTQQVMATEIVALRIQVELAQDDVRQIRQDQYVPLAKCPEVE